MPSKNAQAVQLVKNQPGQPPKPPEKVSEDVSEQDQEIFFRVISTELTPEQAEAVATPPQILQYRAVLAVHWHPEFAPMELIRKRIEAAYPHKSQELIIPTQHNQIMEYDDYAGVEVDCYSRGFNQKVQLLLHFEKSRLEQADVLKAMCAHTFTYRSSQLFDFIQTITEPKDERIEQVVKQTGADAVLVHFVAANVKKIEHLLAEHEAVIPADAIKNKLLRNFFDELRPTYGDTVINRAQNYLKAVKELVKANFSLKYFYRTSEIIEEARALGAGIVIPHPEQFWPILLAEYDVDGIEVWNPQSQRYTDFLISVLNNKNKDLPRHRRRLLILMGDDTHMSEKVKKTEHQDPAKAKREIGYQPAWDDLTIRKKLITADMVKEKVIEEYRARLAG
jgi:hypothetical protein